MDVENGTSFSRNITDQYLEEDKKQNQQAQFYERLFLELITFVGIISVLSNFLLAFVIIKYKRLHKDPTNVIFLHLIVLQAVYLFFTPTTFRLYMDFEIYKYVDVTTTCIIIDCDIVFLLGIILFAFLLLAEWYIKVHTTDVRYQKFCAILKFLVAVIYLVTVGMFFVTVALCVSHSHFSYAYNMLIVTSMFLLLLATVVVLNIVHKIKWKSIRDKTKDNRGLILTNILVFSWLLLLCIVIFSYLGYSLSLMLIISIVLGFFSPVLNLGYLFFHDSDFRVFLNKVFRCQCNDYKNEPLTDNSIRYDEQNGVQIPAA